MIRISKTSVKMLAGFMALMVPALAHAQTDNTDNKLSVKAEVGAAIPLTAPQSNRFDSGVGVGAKGLIALTPWLAVGPAISLVVLPSQIHGVSTGTAWGGGAGVVLRRPHDYIGMGLSAISPWLDSDVQALDTGGLVRPSMSVAVGINLPTSVDHSVWVGPFFRFQNIFPASSNPTLDTRDAKVGIIGLNIELEGRHKITPAANQEPAANEFAPEPTTVPTKNILPPDTTTVNKVVVPPSQFKIVQRIQFDFDSYVLRVNSIGVLQDITATLAANPTYKVRIEGNASSEGDPQYNQVLSLRRAQAVLEYLVVKNVSRSRLSAIGNGISKPIASNSTEAGRQLNRRVEFVTLTITSGDVK